MFNLWITWGWLKASVISAYILFFVLLFDSSLVIAFSASLIQRFCCCVPELKWVVSPLFSQPKDEFPCENDEDDSGDEDDDDDDENEVHIPQLNNLHAVFCNSSESNTVLYVAKKCHIKEFFCLLFQMLPIEKKSRKLDERKARDK